MERDELERVLTQERVVSNEARVSIEEARRRDVMALEMEQERANNLQSVLEDFQACRLFLFQCVTLSHVCTAKDLEIHQAVSDLETRYNDVTVSLVALEHRALTAEVHAPTIGLNGFLLITHSCNSRRINLPYPKSWIWRRSWRRRTF